MSSRAVALRLPGALFHLKALARREAHVCPASEAPGKFLAVPPRQAELESGCLVSILIQSRGSGAGMCVHPSVRLSSERLLCKKVCLCSSVSAAQTWR